MSNINLGSAWCLYCTFIIVELKWMLQEVQPIYSTFISWFYLVIIVQHKYIDVIVKQQWRILLDWKSCFVTKPGAVNGWSRILTSNYFQTISKEHSTQWGPNEGMFADRPVTSTLPETCCEYDRFKC